MVEKDGEIEKAVTLWEIVTAGPALLLSGVVLMQRAFLFRRANSGFLNDDVASLFVVFAILSFIILATKPWILRSRHGSHLRMAGLVVSVWSMMFLVLCALSWSRYKIIRFEILKCDLKISAYADLRGFEIARDVLEPGVGPFILSDEELMRAIVREYGEDLIKSPPSARLLLGGLRNQNVTFEELLKDSANEGLLLGSLMSTANPQPWYELEWAQGLLVDGALDKSTVGETEAEQLVARLMKRLDSLSFQEAEGLVFCLLSRPSLFSAKEREELLESWARRFKTLEALAVEGLLVREEVRAFLGSEPVKKVRFELDGLTGGDYRDKIRVHTIPAAVLGLIRSCGADPEVVRFGETDLTLRATITSIPYAEYERPVYEIESYYETRQTPHTGRFGNRTYKVAKQRRVQTGFETKTEYAPMIELVLERKGKRLLLPSTLLYWYHFTYNKETKRFLEAGDETDFGRMWPFGVRESLYEFPYVLERL